MKSGNQRKFDRVFFQNLVVRQIREDYLDNITGFAWLILQPLILLAVYAFVFTTIFKARIPEAADIAAELPSMIEPGDLVLLLGAGNIGQVAEQIRHQGFIAEEAA